VGIRQRRRLVRVLTAVATIGVLFSAAPAGATVAQGCYWGPHDVGQIAGQLPDTGWYDHTSAPGGRLCGGW
jgi:hypothetical protein